MKMLDKIEQAKVDFCDLESQIVWLAERLSEARILVGHAQCCLCTRMSFDRCKLCWIQAAAKAVRAERHAA